MRSRLGTFVRLGGGEAARPSRRTTGVLLEPALAGRAQLAGPLLDVLLDVEQRGLHIVLLAHRRDDLDAPVAAICRHVIAAEESVAGVARSRWGVAQVVQVAALDDRSVAHALRRLPAPASRTLPRRLQVSSRRVRRLARRLWQARHA